MEQRDSPHLEDLVLQEGKEKPRGWNIDEEFGTGTEERVLRSYRQQLQTWLRKSAAERRGLGYFSMWNTVDLLVLDPKAKISPDERSQFITTAQDGIRDCLADDKLDLVGNFAANILVLGGSAVLSSEDRQRVIDGMKKSIHDSLIGGDDSLAGRITADLRILGEKINVTPEEYQRMDAGMRHDIREAVQSSPSDVTDENIRPLRLLRARKIKVIPGKGIEIIDKETEQFEQQASPLPEVRKF